MPINYRYVVGLAFSPDHSQVLLIEKRRPKWQAGRMNGVGGKVEPGESYVDAMVREFREETGLEVPAAQWRHVVTYGGPDYELLFFSTVANLDETRTMTDEPLKVLSVHEVQTAAVIGNLRWIVPMCLDKHIVVPVSVHE